MLQSIGEDIWIAGGPIVRAYGVPFPTRMAVVRLPGDRLWLWCALEDGASVLRRAMSWLLD